MKYWLWGLFWLLSVPNVWAGEYAVFQHGEERTGWLWHGKEPVPGKDVAADAVVRQLPDNISLDKVQEYRNTGGGLTHEPIIPPTPEPDPVAILDAEIDQKLKAAAKDKGMSDAEYADYRAKLQRAKDIDTLQEKQDKVDEAEAAKPQARRRNDIRRTNQARSKQAQDGRRQLSQSQVRRTQSTRPRRES